jgi:hypothetical protein
MTTRPWQRIRERSSEGSLVILRDSGREAALAARGKEGQWRLLGRNQPRIRRKFSVSEAVESEGRPVPLTLRDSVSE